MPASNGAVRFVACSAMLVSLLALNALWALGQGSPSSSRTANLTTIVFDPTGAVIPNADVTFKGEKTVTTKTGQGGSIDLPLPYGSYAVTISSPGFKTNEIIDFSIDTANPPVLNVVLQIKSSECNPCLPVYGSAAQTITSDVPNILQPRVDLAPLPMPYSGPLRLSPVIAQKHLHGPAGRCSQHNDFRNVNGRYVVDEGSVGYPLRGWVGYTNTGTPVSEMTMECFSREGKLIASAKTDSSGNFSFPKLKPGSYFLKGTKREAGADGSSFQVSTDEVMVSASGEQSDVVSCFVADAEAASR